MRDVEKWAVKFISDNKRDGHIEHFMWAHGRPVLYETRAEARVYIKDNYGYLANRPDLKAEPHGWKMPQPAKVKVKLIELR